MTMPKKTVEMQCLENDRNGLVTTKCEEHEFGCRIQMDTMLYRIGYSQVAKHPFKVMRVAQAQGAHKFDERRQEATRLTASD